MSTPRATPSSRQSAYRRPSDNVPWSWADKASYLQYIIHYILRFANTQAADAAAVKIHVDQITAALLTKILYMPPALDDAEEAWVSLW